MNKFLYLLTEGFKNIWRHKMTTLTAIFSLFISLYIVGLLAVSGNNTNKILQYFIISVLSSFIPTHPYSFHQPRFVGHDREVYFCTLS